MNLYKISDKLVFNILSRINYGYLEITSFDGRTLKFGNPEDSLKANLIIKKPNFTYKLITGGSIGFAECYMRGEFETNNLSNLLGFAIWMNVIKCILSFSASASISLSFGP